MKKNILLLGTAPEIVGPMQELVRGGEDFTLRCSDYLKGLDLLQNGVADAVVMELQGNLTHLQDVFYMLETNGLTPAVLAYELLPDGSVSYSLSDTELLPGGERLRRLFLKAVGRERTCTRVWFRTAPHPEIPPEDFMRARGREEALKEIVRGCSAGELRFYRKLHDFDLRGRGYYLFFRELHYVEYREHRSYKDVLNQDRKSVV